MALFTIKNNKTYRLILRIIEIAVALIILLLIITFFQIMYNGIYGKDHSRFCYALFAANVVLCNSLLAFGRSPVFIERFNIQEQKLIYLSATMFLYAALFGFFLSGWIYVNTDKSFVGTDGIQSTSLGQKLMLGSLAVGLCVSVIFSIVRLGYFFKWSKKAIDKVSSELDAKVTK